MARRDGRGAPVSTRSQQVHRAGEHAVMRPHGGSAYAFWRSPMAPPPVEYEHAIGSGWLERTDPEWAHAWSHFPDPVMAHPVSGECLQYMGSSQYPGRGWVHVFRHRQVPGSDLRQYWQGAASGRWRAGVPRQGGAPPPAGPRPSPDYPDPPPAP